MPVTKSFIEQGHKSLTPDLRLCASNHASKGQSLANMQKSLLGTVQQPSQNHQWTGKAEQAAEGRADRLGQEANAMSGDFTKVGTTLSSFADTVDRCCELANDAIQHVIGFDQVVPMEVSEDLKASDPHFDLAIAHAAFPDRMRKERTEALQKGQAAIDEYVRQMQDAATQAAQTIKDSFAHAADAVPAAEALGKRGHDIAKGIADGTIPLPTDPHVLHDLWMNLSEQEKDEIYKRYPDIGNHGGIPFADRDKYNRQELPKIAKRKNDELEAWERQHPDWKEGRNVPDWGADNLPQGGAAYQEWKAWKEHWNTLKHEADGYQKVQDTLNNASPPRLLGYIDDKGRAAVSINNPDKAKQNATYVPGTSDDIASMLGSDKRSLDMYNAALAQSHGQLAGGDVSVTTWIGYNPPMDLVRDSPYSSYAQAGAQGLIDFQAGLRASHEGPPSYNTVIGHSYGTTLIGAAATGGNHLDADAVVAVGSPGMFANDADGLNLNPGAKVFVGLAANDPIGTSVVSNHFGQNPDTWAHAYKFRTAPGDHSSYFSENSDGLNNMGAIIGGKTGGDGVTPEQ
ncbi:protein of unknown function DUF1023 [Segniliparus rotundus DSM 44985]|uniref:DUF1023 domain-containing protein n=1 Tax=Segniliparus rotundus (strain ATCC BAA-972 / CDC 1076 / CIP 108378 / DSM 44985 / JCM 13578) TaxID=640132 RepID=D6ZDZ3_SEGRD|nr:alpha/beta hydrolase [Segniliparus rotundus]ADG97273.1 protein of unknown function DUF1023 [Segniliparus rotundus DSM 44985]